MNSKEYSRLVELIKSNVESSVIEGSAKMAETGDERFLKEIKDVLADPGITGNMRYHLRKSYNLLVQNCLNSSLVSDQDSSGEGQDHLSANVNINGLSLDHPDPERRIAALRSAAVLDNPDILPHLIALLEKEENLLVTATFLKTLGRLGSTLENKSALFNILKKYLESRDVRIRANCIEAFELLGDPRCIELLPPLLRDSDNRVKANAVKALWKFGNHNVFNYLEKMIESKDEWSRDSAVYALGFMSGSHAEKLLQKCLDDPAESIRKNAELAIQKLHQSEKKEKSSLAFYFVPAGIVALIFLLTGLYFFNLIESTRKKTGPENGEQQINPSVITAPSGLDKTELAEFYYNNSRVFASRDNLLRAVEEIEKAIDLLPKNSSYHLFLASLHEKTGNLMDASRVLTRVLSFSPENQEAMTRLANLNIYNKEYKNALGFLDKLLKNRPDDARLIALRALCYSNLSRFEEAEKDFKKAGKIAPDDHIVNNSMGVFLRKKGNLQQACKYFEKAIKKAPDYMEAYNNLAITYIDMKELGKASSLLRKIILMAPRSWVAQQARIVLSGIKE